MDSRIPPSVDAPVADAFEDDLIAETPLWLVVALRAFAAFILIGFIWVIAVGLTLRSAVSEVRLGQDQLETIRDEQDFEQLLEDGEIANIALAREHLEAAGKELDRWWVRPVSVLPFFGRQLSSARALDAAALDTLDIAETALAGASDLVGSVENTPEGRVTALRALELLLEDTRVGLRAVDLGPSKSLLKPLTDARIEFSEQIDEIVERITDLEVSVGGMTDLLEGPRLYVLAAANNSEMRAGSGMILQTGLLFIEGGELSVTEMDSSYARNPEVGPELSEEHDSLWGWRSPQREWRNLALTPRFAGVTAPLAAAMWEDFTGQEVDGVIVVDPVMMAGLMDLTGPISVLGEEVDSEDILQFLLVEQYLQVEGFEDNRGRRDALGPVAAIVLESLGRLSLEPLELYRSLGDEVAGRHLLAWSRNEREQAAFEAMNIAGVIDENSVAIHLVNTGGNKLDSFIDFSGTIDTQKVEGGTRFTITARLRNNATIDMPVFLGGPHPALGLEPGEYLGLLTFLIPGEATQVSQDPDYRVVVEGTDGPSRVLVHEVSMLAGSGARVVVSFTVAAEHDTLWLEPDARATPTVWKLNGIELRGDGRLELK